MTFYAAIDAADWTQEAVDLYADLSRFVLSEERALVLLCAAARVVTPHMGAATAAYDFGRLVQDAQHALAPKSPARPALSLVGGRNAF